MHWSLSHFTAAKYFWYRIKQLIAPVNNRNTIKKREICSKLTMKTPVVLLSYCYPWTNVTTFSSVTIIKYEQVNNCWAVSFHNWWVFNTFFFWPMFLFSNRMFLLVSIFYFYLKRGSGTGGFLWILLKF